MDGGGNDMSLMRLRLAGLMALAAASGPSCGVELDRVFRTGDTVWTINPRALELAAEIDDGYKIPLSLG